MPAMAELLLKRATAASGEVYDVLSGSRIVGRILLSDASPASQWVWTVSYGYHEGRTPTHGYAESREARDAGIRDGLAQRMKRTRHKRTPSVRRRALEFIAAHPGCAEALLAAENIPADAQNRPVSDDHQTTRAMPSPIRCHDDRAVSAPMPDRSHTASRAVRYRRAAARATPQHPASPATGTCLLL